MVLHAQRLPEFEVLVRAEGILWIASLCNGSGGDVAGACLVTLTIVGVLQSWEYVDHSGLLKPDNGFSSPESRLTDLSYPELHNALKDLFHYVCCMPHHGSGNM